MKETLGLRHSVGTIVYLKCPECGTGHPLGTKQCNQELVGGALGDIEVTCRHEFDELEKVTCEHVAHFCLRCGTRDLDKPCRTFERHSDDKPHAAPPGMLRTAPWSQHNDTMTYAEDLAWFFRECPALMGLRSSFGGQLAAAELGLGGDHEPDAKDDLHYTDSQIHGFSRHRRIHEALSRIPYHHQRTLADYYESRQVDRFLDESAVRTAHGAFFGMVKACSDVRKAAKEREQANREDALRETKVFTISELAAKAGVPERQMRQLVTDAGIGVNLQNGIFRQLVVSEEELLGLQRDFWGADAA